MQDQMNSMNDSGEFQEVESNHGARLSYLPSQPAMIPSSRSMLSRDKRLPFDTWNTSELQGNVFGNQYSTFDSPRPEILLKEFIIVRHLERQNQFHKQLGQGPLSQEMKNKIGAQFQCRLLQEGRRPWVHQYQWKFRRILWLDSKDSRYRTWNSTRSQHRPHSYGGRLDSSQVTTFFLIFPQKLCYGSKKWRWSSRSTHFPNFEMLDARIASALNKIIQNSYFKKKVRLEEQKAQKEDRFPRGRQIAFMIYDYFRVTGAHDTVLDYADLFSVTLRDDNVREFDTRWDEVLLSMSKIPSNDVLECLYNLRICESAQRKTVLELHDMEIHQKISMPNYQNLKTMVKNAKRSEITITKLWRQAREHGNRNSCQESKWIKWRWTRNRYRLPANVRRDTNAVSGMGVKIVHKNRHRKPPHLLSHQWHEVEVCQEKGTSEAKVSLASFFDNRADTFWKVLARDRLVSIGILPNVN